MMTEKNMVDEHTYLYKGFKKHISYTAIITGTLVALGISFLFYLFGAAIGLTFFKATETGVNTLAIGGFLGSIISAVISMFVGGWISGYLARKKFIYRDNTVDHEEHHCGNIGVLYGFVTWVLTLIVSILLAADVSSYIATRYYRATNPTFNLINKKLNPEASMKNDQRMNSNENPSSRTKDDRTNSNDNAYTRDNTSSRDNDSTRPTSDEEKAANTAGKTLFAIFVVFFLGAFGSCIGGFMGIKHRCHHNDEDDRRLNKTNPNNPRI